jgi:hypothetical protein
MKLLDFQKKKIFQIDNINLSKTIYKVQFHKIMKRINIDLTEEENKLLDSVASWSYFQAVKNKNGEK